MHKILVATLAATVLAACNTVPPMPSMYQAPAVDMAEQVHTMTLKNGMKIIVKEDHRAPVVTSMVWYRIGSSYEEVGTTGVSHVLEHMMFKGTQKFPAGEFSRIIAANGGRENAFTGRDYTAYFQTLESSRLSISLQMEADRMRGALMLPEEFAKEIEVVMEERRMRTDDDPQSLTYEVFNASAYGSSSYRWPVIGWMEDLKAMTATDIRVWYDQWYRPNNATLVVAGDVTAKDVFALAEKYFAPLEAGPVPQRKPRQEFAQKGLKRVQVKAPAQVPYLIMGYKTPSLNDPIDDSELYALEVLAGILDGGNSARLARNLVRGQEIANSAGAGYDMYTMGQELFMLDGTPARGRSVADLEQALRQQVADLKQSRVTTDELARVKAQVMASKVYEKDSLFYQAMQLGMLETTGFGWQKQQGYLNGIRAVTAEQVQQVAQKYLVDEVLTIAELVPLPLDSQTPQRRATGGRHGR